MGGTHFQQMMAIISFVLLLLYTPVAILGYSVYGDKLQPIVMDSLPHSSAKSAIQVLLALHALFAFLLVINATSQEFEELLSIPNKFGWKRCLLRSCMLFFIAFVAQSIPKFGKVLDLVGGSAITLTASVCPCLFYYKLSSQENPEWPDRSLPFREKLYLVFIMVCGLVGGSVCTYAAIKSIVGPGSFNPPCYVNITAASEL